MPTNGAIANRVLRGSALAEQDAKAHLPRAQRCGGHDAATCSVRPRRAGVVGQTGGRAGGDPRRPQCRCWPNARSPTGYPPPNSPRAIKIPFTAILASRCGNSSMLGTPIIANENSASEGRRMAPAGLPEENPCRSRQAGARCQDVGTGGKRAIVS